MPPAIQNDPARIGDPKAKKCGTFSYLPAMTAAEVRAQIAYMIARGWQCAVEHAAPDCAGDDYWSMWKLPLFGERDVDAVMAELAACRDANPGHEVRLVGYDPKRQTRGLAFVVYRAEG